jgi:hypothetical protein
MPAPRPVFDDARPALTLALFNDHLYGCDQNTCDIRMAAGLGLHYCAARILVGSTEAPNTNAVLATVPGWENYERYEFAIFTPWFAANTLECPGCGSFIQFDPSSSRVTATCANCLTVTDTPARA